MQTDARTDDTAVSLPPIFQGDTLYDLIMSDIEPELTSERLPSIDAIVQGESEEQRTARAKRYEEAFAEYDRRLQKHMDLWNSTMQLYKNDSRSMAEHIVGEAESKEISELSSSIDQA